MDIQLTPEQTQLIQYLQHNRFAAISGCAGSGKTKILLAHARFLDNQGLRVLFLCRNPFLAARLADELQGTRVAVFAFSALVQFTLRNFQAGGGMPLPRPAWVAHSSQHQTPSPQELSRVLDILAYVDPAEGSARYDAVIVDEGQDFELNWLEVAEAFLESLDRAYFVIAFDDNPLLLAFSPHRFYADLQAPVTLKRNCRSSGEIDTLVRRFHPGETLPGPHAGDKATLGEWLYRSEGELLEGVHQALLKAEDFAPDMKDVVVLTAEIAPAGQSKLAGLTLDSPRLRAASTPGRLDWQTAVLRYLQGFGLLESDLSGQATPTQRDIQRVNQFCAAYQIAHRRVLSQQRSDLAKRKLVWRLDAYGQLNLRWADQGKPDVAPVDLLAFFNSPKWAEGLPSAHKRYRITPMGEFEKLPDAHHIPLADISSFKGLEADALVLVLYNYYAGDRDQFLANLYIAFSRARRFLYLVAPAALQEELFP